MENLRAQRKKETHVLLVETNAHVRRKILRRLGDGPCEGQRPLDGENLAVFLLNRNLEGWLLPRCQVGTSALRTACATSTRPAASPKLRVLSTSCLLAEMNVGRVGCTRAVLHPH